MNYEIDTYEPCPCGSGGKYKFCCLAKAKAARPGRTPDGVVAFFGPDDQTATKIVAAAIVYGRSEPVVQRWTAENIRNDAHVTEEVKRFFANQGVKKVTTSEAIVGCPHEEGIDYAKGEDCPHCPFWAGKQGSRAEKENRHQAPLDQEAGDEFDDDEFDEASEFDDELDGENSELERDDDEDERNWDTWLDKAFAILGDEEIDLSKGIDLLLANLKANLSLPCEVKGIEEFRWEYVYTAMGWSAEEYAAKKESWPSFEDRFQLLGVERGDFSKWMLYCEDILASVRRISDGKEFVLGLSELKAIDKESENYQLMQAYRVWFTELR